ncbi:MAG: AraC family transcriptional regulator [Bacteroidia bacterium]
MHTIRIKHMVCRHCARVVKEELAQIPDLILKEVHLGLVEFEKAPTDSQMKMIRQSLEANGFELIDDQKSELIEQVKTLLIGDIHHQKAQKPAAETYSDFLSRKIGYEYSYLNELFSSTEGKTIGQYIILQKIERVKELLIYDEKNLAEIAFSLEYSSAQYLSSQFKKFTGMTPTQFRKIGMKDRKSLDKV